MQKQELFRVLNVDDLQIAKISVDDLRFPVKNDKAE